MQGNNFNLFLLLHYTILFISPLSIFFWQKNGSKNPFLTYFFKITLIVSKNCQKRGTKYVCSWKTKTKTDKKQKLWLQKKGPEKPQLMAPQINSGAYPFTWSQCSRRSITNFLDSGSGNCLQNKPINSDFVKGQKCYNVKMQFSK